MLDVLVGRVRSAVLAAWGGFIGLLPHVLHHVGPLAGAALLAGTEGTILFATIGFVAAVPFLLRVTGASAPGGLRRSRSPSSPRCSRSRRSVIGPAISGGEDTSPRPGIEDADHQEHH